MSNEENRAEQNDAVPNGEGCPICFEYAGNEPRQACCRQRFHAACVARWIASGRNSCPMCRTPYGVAQGPVPQLDQAAGPVLAQPAEGNDRPRGLNMGQLQLPAPNQVLLLQARIADLENVIRIEREQHSQLVMENGRLRRENRRLETELGWLEQLNDNAPQILELARNIAALAPR
jgi:hypothetical protein